MGMADDARRRLEAENSAASTRDQTVEKLMAQLDSQLNRLVPECVQALRQLGCKPRNLVPHDKTRIFQKRKKMGWNFIVYVGYTHSDHSNYFGIQAYPDESWAWVGNGPVGQIRNCLNYGSDPLLAESSLREKLSKQVTEFAAGRGY